jgi:hypothetical protein
MFHVCVEWKYCNLEIIHKVGDIWKCIVFDFGGPCATIEIQKQKKVDSIPRVVSMCVFVLCLIWWEQEQNISWSV